jgi:hypothetical protein
MLTAYFDDSGTHGNSEIVLMAGVYGHFYQWNFFSDLWAKQLAAPCPGKPPLSEFHMSECQARDGEFLGWKRVETDFLVRELGSIIIKTGIYGFGGAIPRQVWDEFIQGDLRRSAGDAETMCIINCFVKVTRWAKEKMPGHKIGFVFDDRPQKKRDVQKIFDVYRGFTDGKPEPGSPEITSVSFASSRKALPLQAADMLAWEIYQDSLDSLAGRPERDGPRRKQLLRLLQTGRINVEFCGPELVRKMAERKFDPSFLSTIANHVDFR